MLIKNNEEGMTLVEMMVAAGLTGLVALGVSQMLTNTQKEQQKMELDFAISSIEKELEQAIRIPANYKRTYDLNQGNTAFQNCIQTSTSPDCNDISTLAGKTYQTLTFFGPINNNDFTDFYKVDGSRCPASASANATLCPIEVRVLTRFHCPLNEGARVTTCAKAELLEGGFQILPRTGSNLTFSTRGLNSLTTSSGTMIKVVDILNDNTDMKCNDGEVFLGIDSNGQPLCQPGFDCRVVKKPTGDAYFDSTTNRVFYTTKLCEDFEEALGGGGNCYETNGTVNIVKDNFLSYNAHFTYEPTPSSSFKFNKNWAISCDKPSSQVTLFANCCKTGETRYRQFVPNCQARSLVTPPNTLNSFYFTKNSGNWANTTSTGQGGTYGPTAPAPLPWNPAYCGTTSHFNGTSGGITTVQGTFPMSDFCPAGNRLVTFADTDFEDINQRSQLQYIQAYQANSSTLIKPLGYASFTATFFGAATQADKVTWFKRLELPKITNFTAIPNMSNNTVTITADLSLWGVPNCWLGTHVRLNLGPNAKAICCVDTDPSNNTTETPQ